MHFADKLRRAGVTQEGQWGADQYESAFKPHAIGLVGPSRTFQVSAIPMMMHLSRFVDREEAVDG